MHDLPQAKASKEASVNGPGRANGALFGPRQAGRRKQRGDRKPAVSSLRRLNRNGGLTARRNAAGVCRSQSVSADRRAPRSGSKSGSARPATITTNIVPLRPPTHRWLDNAARKPRFPLPLRNHPGTDSAPVAGSRGKASQRGGEGMDVFIQQLPVFVQQLINGVTLGSIYGLIAIGYTMVFGIIGMINFAHGDVFMIGAFIALMAILAIGLTASANLAFMILALVLVLVIAMMIAAAYNWTIERVAYRPLRGSFRLAPLISAIGMSIVLPDF